MQILIEEPRTSFTSTNCIPRIGIQNIAFVIELRDLLARGLAGWIRCDVPLHNISGSLRVPCFYLIRRKREQTNETIRNSFFLVLVSQNAKTSENSSKGPISMPPPFLQIWDYNTREFLYRDPCLNQTTCLQM